MILHVAIAMHVTGAPHEQEEVDRLNAEIERDGRQRDVQSTRIDLTHMKDIAIVMRQVNEILNRAHVCLPQDAVGDDEPFPKGGVD